MHIGLSSDMGGGGWVFGVTGSGCFPAAKPHVHLPLLFSGSLVGDEPEIEVQMLEVKRKLVPGNLQLDLQAIGDVPLMKKKKEIILSKVKSNHRLLMKGLRCNGWQRRVVESKQIKGILPVASKASCGRKGVAAHIGCLVESQWRRQRGDEWKVWTSEGLHDSPVEHL
ncbi:cytosolic invertase 1 [Striga asiatica]|uniref:Cytosolic invertase 1 n=1 Tax=Striga asiatica TaxID=4170 RepID=A0A5A7Q334_STRAF|nr:cytosolic invertase 1 [Striga asiatica]